MNEPFSVIVPYIRSRTNKKLYKASIYRLNAFSEIKMECRTIELLSERLNAIRQCSLLLFAQKMIKWNNRRQSAQHGQKRIKKRTNRTARGKIRYFKRQLFQYLPLCLDPLRLMSLSFEFPLLFHAKMTVALCVQCIINEKNWFSIRKTIEMSIMSIQTKSFVFFAPASSEQCRFVDKNTKYSLYRSRRTLSYIYFVLVEERNNLY